MKNMFIFIALFLLSITQGNVYAEIQAKDSTMQLCDQAIKGIANDVNLLVEGHESFKDLKEVEKVGISKNVTELVYVNPELEGEKVKDVIKITFYNYDEDLQEQVSGSKVWRFPFLGVKLSAYVFGNRSFQLKVFDVVKKNLVSLNYSQQQEMDLRLFIVPEKSLYKMGDKITFDVVLKNNGKTALKVRELTNRSLFCSVNDRKWGTDPLTGVIEKKERILEPAKDIKSRYKTKIDVFSDEMEIFCSYNMAVKGVLPEDRVRLKIKKVN